MSARTNSVLRENNKQIVYKYDGLNRLVRICYPDIEDTLYVYGGASDARAERREIPATLALAERHLLSPKMENLLKTKEAWPKTYRLGFQFQAVSAAAPV